MAAFLFLLLIPRLTSNKERENIFLYIKKKARGGGDDGDNGGGGAAFQTRLSIPICLLAWPSSPRLLFRRPWTRRPWRRRRPRRALQTVRRSARQGNGCVYAQGAQLGLFAFYLCFGFQSIDPSIHPSTNARQDEKTALNKLDADLDDYMADRNKADEDGGGDGDGDGDANDDGNGDGAADD